MPDGTSALSTIPIAFQPYVVESGLVTVEGQDYPYVVLSPDARQPQFFCGHSREADLYFISLDVPVEYRPPVLLHEVLEHGRLKASESPCWAALQAELASLDGLNREAYLRWRCRSFLELSRFVHQRGHRDSLSTLHCQDVSLCYTDLHSRVLQERWS